MPNSRVYRRKDVKDDSVWWARWWNGEKWIRRSTGLTDRVAAQQWLSQRERETVSPTPIARSASLLEALEKIEQSNAIGDATKRMYSHRGAQLMQTIGNVNLFALTRDEVLKHIGVRLAKGISRNTVNKELITLSRALQMVDAPLDAVNRKKLEFKFKYVPKKRWLTFQEFIALCLRLEPKRKLWVTVACYTGGSRSEIERLRCEDIDFRRDIVHIPGTKTADRDRYVPLHPALRQVLLLEGVDQRKGSLLEHWGKANRDIAAACKRASIDRCSPHDFRRTFGSWLIQAGVPLAVARRLMGHASVKMLDMVYGQVDQVTLANAVALLPSSVKDDGAE